MKENKIYTLIIVIFTMIFFTGCTDWLDLRPENEKVLEEYWQSESDVQGVLASCYRGLIEDDVMYRMIAWGEMRSDNIIVGTGFPDERKDLLKILQGDLTQTNAYCSWGSFYAVINYCNTLLYYAPLVIDRDNNFTEADLHLVQSEALTIRALAYFYLVRTFKEVPLVLEASIDDTQNFNLPKSSEGEIISQILKDLTEAKKYARNEYPDLMSTKGRVTLNLVNTLMADVYLWNQQYKECISSCDEVLKDKRLKLVPEDQMFTSVFYNKNSSESIFELQYDDKVQYNKAVTFLYGGSGLVEGEFSFPMNLAYNVKTKVAGAYSPFAYIINANLSESMDDIRAKTSFRSDNAGTYYIFKYAGKERNLESTTNNYIYRSNTPNWIVYRLSDVYLMKAEALAGLDSTVNLTNAVRLVNKTYLRSNEGVDSLYFDNYKNKVEVERLILRERQREFLFEGKRWYDLVRTARREGSTATLNEYVNHKTSIATSSLGASVPDAMYMPIANSELIANPKMQQNSYYDESR